MKKLKFGQMLSGTLALLLAAGLIVVGGLALSKPVSTHAMASLDITPITWNYLGATDPVTSGPTLYPVGVRVRNTSSNTITNVKVSFQFTTNFPVDLGLAIDGPNQFTYPQLGPNESRDVYFFVRIIHFSPPDIGLTTGYPFVILASADGVDAVSTPDNVELTAEWIEQDERLLVAGDIIGPASLEVGNVYTFTIGATRVISPLHQLENFITFPTDLFQVEKIETTYSDLPGIINDKPYYDACGWDNDFESDTYLMCIGDPDATVGGLVTTKYTVRALAAGSASLVHVIYGYDNDYQYFLFDQSDVKSVEIVNTDPQADLAVTKTDGVTTVTPGQTVTYTVMVSNIGNAPAADVDIIDTLSDGMTIVSYNLHSLDVSNVEAKANSLRFTLNPDLVIGQPITFEIIARVADPLPPGLPDVRNTASATTTTNETNLANNSATDINSITGVQKADLTVDKDDGKTSAIAGEELTYTVTIANAGGVLAGGVVITDTFSTGLTFVSVSPPLQERAGSTDSVKIWEIPQAIAAGDDYTFTVKAKVVNPIPSGLTQVVNSVKVSTTTPESNIGNNTDSDTNTIGQTTPGLDIHLSVSDDSVLVGDLITYTVDLTNTGSTSLSSVVLTDVLPDTLDYKHYSFLPGSGTVTYNQNTRTVTANIFSIAGNNGKVTLRIVARPNSKSSRQTVQNHVKAAWSNQTKDSNTVSVTVDPAADLQAGITDNDLYISSAETVSYTISITNTGSLTATNVIITDTIGSALSTNLTYVSINKNSVDMTEIRTSPVHVWKLTNPIAPGKKVTFYITAKAASSLSIGTKVTHTVIVSASPPEGGKENNIATDVNTVPTGGSLSMTKSVSPISARVGENFTFTIRVTNNGSVAATNVKVTDTLSSYLDYVSSSSTVGGNPTVSVRTVTANIGTLNANATATVTIVARVNSSAPSTTTSVSNTATVIWDPSRSTSAVINFSIIPGGTLPGTGWGPPEEMSLPAAQAQARGLSGLMWAVLITGLILAGLGLAAVVYGVRSRDPQSEWSGWFIKTGIVIGGAGLLFCLAAAAMSGLAPSPSELAQRLLSGPPPALTDLPRVSRPEDPPSIYPTPTPLVLPDYPIPTPSVMPDGGPGAEPPDTSAAVRLIIPSIDLDTVIKYVPFNDSTWLIGGLKQEIAWMGDTSWPGLGGNTGLAGHVTLANGADGPFRFLSNLQAGDRVTLYTEQNIYEYKVREQKVVDSSDLSVIRPTEQPQITLITCAGWDKDLKVYRQRIIVYADLTGSEPRQMATKH